MAAVGWIGLSSFPRSDVGCTFRTGRSPAIEWAAAICHYDECRPAAALAGGELELLHSQLSTGGKLTEILPLYLVRKWCPIYMMQYKFRFSAP